METSTGLKFKPVRRNEGSGEVHIDPDQFAGEGLLRLTKADLEEMLKALA